MPTYNKSKKNVFLQYFDANNLYDYATDKTVTLNGYKWADVSVFTAGFTKNYDDKGGKGYSLELDVEYPKELLSAHKDLTFLPERRFKLHKEFQHKVSKKIEKAH